MSSRLDYALAWTMVVVAGLEIGTAVLLHSVGKNFDAFVFMFTVPLSLVAAYFKFKVARLLRQLGR